MHTNMAKNVDEQTSLDSDQNRKGKYPEKLRRHKRRPSVAIRTPAARRRSKNFRRGLKALRIFCKGPCSEGERELLTRYQLLDATIAHVIYEVEGLYYPMEIWYIVPG